MVCSEVLGGLHELTALHLLKQLSKESKNDGKGGARYSGVVASGFIDRLQRVFVELGDSVENVLCKLIACGRVLPEQGSIRHDLQRARLNSVTRAWTTSVCIRYRPRFDPFAPPRTTPEDVGEIRFPVIWLEGSEVDKPRPQVEIVYKPDHWYLEFFSAAGKTKMSRNAAQVGLGLEMWDAPLHER